MTPLHWACYHGDKDLVTLLVHKLSFSSKIQTAAKVGKNKFSHLYPVDVAGIRNHKEIVEILCNDLQQRILKRN